MAPRIGSKFLTSILRTPRLVAPPSLRPYPRLPRNLQPVARRFAHTIPRPPASSVANVPSGSQSRKLIEPHYLLTFTCVPCGTRSGHKVSKQGYHKGSVLITCPECRNRHVMSDNLNIFGDRKITIEDLLREKGQLVKRGTLGEDGDIEFWQDAPADATENEEASGPSAEGEEEVKRPHGAPIAPSNAHHSTHSASVLTRGSGARPSVQDPAHSSPTPSTRRQYTVKAFRPPWALIARGIKPINRTVESPVKAEKYQNAGSARLPKNEWDKRGKQGKQVKQGRQAKQGKQGKQGMRGKQGKQDKQGKQGKQVKQVKQVKQAKQTGLVDHMKSLSITTEDTGKSIPSKAAPKGAHKDPDTAAALATASIRRVKSHMNVQRPFRLVTTRGAGGPQAVLLSPTVSLKRRPPGGILPATPTDADPDNVRYHRIHAGDNQLQQQHPGAKRLKKEIEKPLPSPVRKIALPLVRQVWT